MPGKLLTFRLVQNIQQSCAGFFLLASYCGKIQQVFVGEPDELRTARRIKLGITQTSSKVVGAKCLFETGTGRGQGGGQMNKMHYPSDA